MAHGLSRRLTAFCLSALCAIPGVLSGCVSETAGDASHSESLSETESAPSPGDIARRRIAEAESTAKEIIESHEAVKEAIAEALPYIVCWGSSSIYGAGSGGATLPVQLESYIQEIIGTYDPASRLDENFSYLLEDVDLSLAIPVYNMGVGGETSATIVGRAGAIPFVLTESVTIPAGETKVEVRFSAADGHTVDPLLQDKNGKCGVNPVVLSGVTGILTTDATDVHPNVPHRYYFTRSDSGSSVYVPAGTEIRTAGNDYRDGYPVIYIGANGGYDSASDLIRQIGALIGTHERFLVIGMHTGSRASRAELENALSAAYGDRFLNLREYVSGIDAVNDANTLFNAGITLSDSDKALMADGTWPTVFRTDGAHFNPIGYRLFAYAVETRMEELGDFDALRNALFVD